jgi:thiol-disulfide isomerase/thioredoxin
MSAPNNPGVSPPVAPLSAMRRRWLFAGVAGAAAAAGFGLAWRNGHVGPAPLAPLQALWELDFATPQGRRLAMRSFQGKPLLLNFWATWCPPCVEEMPLLDRFFAENSSKGWQVLGLAVDQMAPVTRFLQRTPVRFPIALAGLAGADLSRTLGNTGGGLPFTVVFDAAGAIAHRKMGQLTPQDLQQWLAMR